MVNIRGYTISRCTFATSTHLCKQRIKCLISWQGAQSPLSHPWLRPYAYVHIEIDTSRRTSGNSRWSVDITVIIYKLLLFGWMYGCMSCYHWNVSRHSTPPLSFLILLHLPLFVSLHTHTHIHYRSKTFGICFVQFQASMLIVSQNFFCFLSKVIFFLKICALHIPMNECSSF